MCKYHFWNFFCRIFFAVIICDFVFFYVLHRTDPNNLINSSFMTKVVKEMAKKGITLYSVGCEPAITPYKDFFSAIAFATGGQYVPLQHATLLSKVIVGGALEEMSLERLMEQVQLEVRDQMERGNTDEALLAECVQER